MRPSKRRSKRPTGPGEQLFVSLVVILLGLGFCLIPLFFGFDTINVRGNKGPGGAAALIIGVLFVLFGLVGLCLGLAKILGRIIK